MFPREIFQMNTDIFRNSPKMVEIRLDAAAGVFAGANPLFLI